MKAKLKKTGELINIADYSRITLDKCDSYGNPIEVGFDEITSICDDNGLILGLPKFVTPRILNVNNGIDLEARRYEIAKEAMTAIMSNSEFYQQVLYEDAEKNKRQIPNSISEAAVIFADALIKELKKEK